MERGKSEMYSKERPDGVTTREDKVKLNREKYQEIAEFMDLLRTCFKNAKVTNLKEST